MSEKIGMISLGCPKNQVDAEMMAAKLRNSDFSIVDDEKDADLIIINTCGFIESAKVEAIETILETAQLKQTGNLKALVVTGCLAERYKEQILLQIPEVDSVIGIGADGDIVKVCQKALRGVSTSFYPGKELLPLDGDRILSTPPHWAYLKISDGCSNKCSYCAIPGIRGEFRSRKIESIVNEAQQLAADGVKELVLIAQDTTRYGIDIYNKLALVDLLGELVKIDGISWIRLLYCYPDRITDELLELMAKEEKICNYIDIPLQHSNDYILQLMNRSGSSKSLTALISKIRSFMADVSLRTTFMTGFPYEEDSHFNELCEFVKENEFDKLGCFTFSPEEDTPAALMEQTVPEDVKKKREQILMEQQFYIVEKKNKKLVGSRYKAIIDRFDDEENSYFARTYMDCPEIDTGVLVSSEEPLKIGEFYNLEIIGTQDYDLIGKVVD